MNKHKQYIVPIDLYRKANLVSLYIDEYSIYFNLLIVPLFLLVNIMKIFVVRRRILLFIQFN